MSISCKLHILQTKCVYDNSIYLYGTTEGRAKETTLRPQFFKSGAEMSSDEPFLASLDYKKDLIVISRKVPGTDSGICNKNVLNEQCYSIYRTLLISDIGRVAESLRMEIIARDRLRALLWEALGPSKGALVWSLVYGVQREIPDTVRSAFLSTGTLHLAALSGSNVSTWLTVLRAGTRGVKRRNQKAWILLGSLVFYAVSVQASPSIVRALVQAALYLIAEYSGRKILEMQSLLWALLLTCSINPLWIGDVGLWLSFSSSFALTLQGTFLRTDTPSGSIAKEFYTSLVCTWSTLPIILIVFKKISFNGVVLTPFLAVFTVFFSAFGLLLTTLFYLLSFITWSGATLGIKLLFEVPTFALEYMLSLTKDILPFNWSIESTLDLYLLLFSYLVITVTVIWFLVKRRRSGGTRII